ncbi:cysteine--tRNA ligase [Natronospora cellulosivora (SeqCode)]
MKVYNTLTRKKEEFKPINDDRVMIYVCGLTVQNFSHLGHIRAAVNYDVVRRYLEYKGYDVEFIQNFTDINEKIVQRAVEEGLSPEDLAEKYTKAYLEDIEKLNVKRASKYPKATENMDAIIELVEKLIEKGYAYEVNGNVYFDVEKFDSYGKLSGRTLEDMKAGARIEILEEKKNPMDFALWKKAPEGEKDWESPWGRGWPGWHIECSAMSMKYLGKKFDIHGGGADLIFPHHENEIAQSQACVGPDSFAKYWLHNGAVRLKGEKMSKSLGNFFTTRELLKKYDGSELRYFLLTKHYRSPIDFSFEEIESTNAALKRVLNTINNVNEIINRDLNKQTSEVKKEYKIEQFDSDLIASKTAFEEALDDDFNTAQAIGVLHELIKEINRLINKKDFNLTKSNSDLLMQANYLLNKFLTVLGIKPLEDGRDDFGDSETVNSLMNLLLDVREEARQKKDWDLADMIRNRLNELGVVVKDTPQGVIWEKESDK